jgi:hypothetical protein
LKKKNISTNNVIFVFDMAYDSYDLFNYMDINNYKYVCRVKKYSLYLDKDKDKNKDKINKKKNKLENEKVIFILYQHKYSHQNFK